MARSPNDALVSAALDQSTLRACLTPIAEAIWDLHGALDAIDQEGLEHPKIRAVDAPRQFRTGAW